MAEIKVLKAGLFSTIQDLGRFNFRKFGVPQSGAMDSYAARLVNLILHNPENSAVMEITQTGPELMFSHPTEIAIGGAEFSAGLNDLPLQNNRIYRVGAGDVLKFQNRSLGCRAYLGVSGGFQVDQVLGSKSWYEGLTEHYRLEKDMRLTYTSFTGKETNLHTSIKYKKEYLDSNLVTVYPGPEFEHLNENQKTVLSGKTFTLDSKSNRMAIQFKEPMENTLIPIITGPVLPGTVQLTPSGNIIVLMKDCQTTGGYPRILQVSDWDLNCLAQKNPGEKISFSLLEEM